MGELAVLVGFGLVACLALSRFSVVGRSGVDRPDPALDPVAPEPVAVEPAEVPEGGVLAVWRLLGPVAVAGVVVSAVTVAATYLGDHDPVPASVAAPLRWAALVFLGLAAVTLVALWITGGRALFLGLDEVSRPARLVVWLLVAAAWGVVALTDSDGEPEAVGGRYFVVGDGSPTEVDRDGYDRAVVLERRSDAAQQVVAFAPGVGLGLCAGQVRRGSRGARRRVR